MNHSCSPNCELQKWVVGNQMRIGIFTIKDVAEGDELTFDYKFERYGYKLVAWILSFTCIIEMKRSLVIVVNLSVPDLLERSNPKARQCK